MRRPEVRRPRKAASVTLSEEDGIRYLHFGTEWIQGGMRVARPFALELEYQRQMMAVGLFLPEPRRIVQLGLGAAALTKFCWCEVSSASIVAVELSVDVIDAAHAWFCLPPDDARLNVVNADAREFISHPRQRGLADWLQVDLYDAAARGPVYDDVAFYRACRKALRAPGVASFNLFGARFRSQLCRHRLGVRRSRIGLARSRCRQPRRIGSCRASAGRAVRCARPACARA